MRLVIFIKVHRTDLCLFNTTIHTGTRVYLLKRFEISNTTSPHCHLIKMIARINYYLIIIRQLIIVRNNKC